MRVFTAVRHSRDPSQYYGGLWSGNFYPGLRRRGCEIVESQVDLLPASRFLHVAGPFTKEERAVRGGITQQILDELRRCHAERPIGLFLSYFYNAHFEPGGFEQIHRMGIPTINFYCNSIHQFELVAEVARKVTFSWHAEKEARASYLNVGANPIWVQMGADPHVYRPMPDMAREPKACFVGQRYADRDRWLAALVRAGVPVAIYGPGWRGEGADSPPCSGTNAPPRKRLGRVTPRPGSAGSYLATVAQNVWTEGLVVGLARTWKQARHLAETRQLLPLLSPFSQGEGPAPMMPTVARYEVALNFSNVWADGRPASRLIPHVRLRDFEAPMCRTCYVTGHTDEITEFYEPDREIITYRTPEELIDKVSHYLARPDEAERVREAGYRRALRDHTWEQRFKQLFRATGLEKEEMAR